MSFVSSWEEYMRRGVKKWMEEHPIVRKILYKSAGRMRRYDRTKVNAKGNRVYYYFKDKIQTWRKIPPIPEFLWRYSLAYNFNFETHSGHSIPVHHKYYGALCQIWRIIKDRRDVTEDIAEIELTRFLEEFLGFDESEWWFEVTVGGGWQEVPFEKELVNLKRLCIEDETGSEVDSDEETLA